MYKKLDSKKVGLSFDVISNTTAYLLSELFVVSDLNLTLKLKKILVYNNAREKRLKLLS